ncbi:MAG TPA: hypothetical protein VGQ68_06555 [Gaiellaceae bacterium]|nr:hypothetical protein [Gaiellaceae bacterium]
MDRTTVEAPPVETEQATDGTPDSEAWTTAQTGSISFAELVRTHHDWDRDRGATEKVERRYRQALERFQEKEGELMHAYWARKRASAIALTEKRKRRQNWLVRLMTNQDSIIRLHRVTDWVARESKVADLLHHCDTLAIKVSEVLQGTTERIAMQWIYAVQSHLLGFIERRGDKADAKEINAVCASQAKELIQIERYYARAGEKEARIVYFWGMVIGVLVSGALAILLALLVWATGWFSGTHTHDMETFFVCFAAGGLGAVVSVLMRMSSNRFAVDFEVGRATVRVLGSFRPFIGAVFGIALYFLVLSKLLRMELPSSEGEAFFFLGTLAFLSGFNERWTNVLFGKVERTIAASLGDATTTDEDEDK